MFAAMMERIEEESLQYLFKVQLQPATEQQAPPAREAERAKPERRRPAGRSDMASPAFATAAQGPSPSRKIGRNEPCICGSGKKYKKCCGK
jgi:preprotein translocase subunit SecA